MAVGRTVGEFFYLTAVKILYREDIAVEDKRELLAVGAYLRHGALVFVSRKHLFLLESRGVGKVGFIVRARHCGFVDVVKSVALGSIIEGLAIVAPYHIVLSLGGSGDLTGGRVVG